MLRHQAPPSPAGDAEEVRPDLAALERVHEDVLGPARQQAFETGLAEVQRLVVSLNQDVERAELGLVIMLARMRRVEVGDAIATEHHGFAIDHMFGFRWRCVEPIQAG